MTVQPQLFEEYSLRVVSGAMPLQIKDCRMRPVVASSSGAILYRLAWSSVNSFA